MIGKQLKIAKYRELQTYLSQNARHEPHCPAYEIALVLNGVRYTLFIQLDRHCKVYALYALRFSRERDAGTEYPELITENLVLSALMELMIFQCVT